MNRMDIDIVKAFMLETLNIEYYTLFEYCLTRNSKHSETYSDAVDVSNAFAHASNLKIVWLELSAIIRCLYFMNGTEFAERILNDPDVVKGFEKLKTSYGLDFSKKIEQCKQVQAKVELGKR